MKPMKEPSRLEPVQEPFEEGVAELLAGARAPDGGPMAILATLAHHPGLLRQFNRLTGFLLTKGSLPGRTRELAILRVAARTRSIYEYGQHRLIASANGLAREEIRNTARELDRHPWNPRDRLVLEVADELIATDSVGDELWARMKETWTSKQLVELVVVIGYYRMVAGVLNTFGVLPEDGVPGWDGEPPYLTRFSKRN